MQIYVFFVTCETIIAGNNAPPMIFFVKFASMNLDAAFVDALHELLGAEATQLVEALASAPSVSVRVNPLRGCSVAASATRVPWCPSGFYCDERPAFTFDPLHHGGCYYVQDASSMFITHVIAQLIDGPVRYLDLCAAPGGKTTAALQALPQGSMVVANEVMPGRAMALADNVTRWGDPAVVVTKSTAAQVGRLVGMFDVMATDVPCSGEGMMRKDSEAVAQWTPTLVSECATRQRQILTDAWPALREGGLLIYSTCTFNRHENEEMVQFIIDQLGAEPVAVPTDPAWRIMAGIDTPHPVYRFMPHRTRGEGLFMAVLRKTAPTGPSPKAPKNARNKGAAAIPAAVKKWVEASLDLSTHNDYIIATPPQVTAVLRQLGESLHVLQAGVTVAAAGRNKVVPQHALAMSAARTPGAFPHVEVDYATAISYLQGQAITIDAPRGYVLVNYRGTTLGLVNNLGARANNLYPKPLRILSSHVPTEPVTLDGLA